jgi:hypothetical protein
MPQHKLLEKQEQPKPKSSRRDIIKIRAEINEIESKKKKKKKTKINETKSWLFEKINVIDKPLENLTKTRREQTQISKIRNAKGEKTTNTKENQGMTMDYFENLYSKTLENIEEMEKFLDTYDHAILNQEDINHLNRSKTHKKIEAAIKSLPK